MAHERRFTEDEWKELKVVGLRFDHWIRAKDGSYWRPDPDEGCKPNERPRLYGEAFEAEGCADAKDSRSSTTSSSRNWHQQDWTPHEAAGAVSLPVSAYPGARREVSLRVLRVCPAACPYFVCVREYAVLVNGQGGVGPGARKLESIFEKVTLAYLA